MHLKMDGEIAYTIACFRKVIIVMKSQYSSICGLYVMANSFNLFICRK